MNLFRRENYLQKIRGFYHDTGMIKVITGVRRCGKSCLMQTIAEELTESGIPADNLEYINLDRREYRAVTTPDQLEQVIDAQRTTGSTTNITYLFIDEVQNVRGFEEVLNALREEGNFSIFITGSNSYLLSGELITKLTGRYIEFELFPLTFDEYLGMKAFMGISQNANLATEFAAYLTEGGFPKTLQYETLQDKQTYVNSVISEIMEKDIRRRVKIRNVTDFNKVMQYVINNFGATTNLSNLLSDLHKTGSSIKRETLNRYIQILLDAKILHKCTRFDMKSRRSIGTQEKYYLADLSFYFATNTDNRINYGPVLENVVYIYARAKGYAVSVGRIGRLECDFIVRSPARDYAYIQVAQTIMTNSSTEDREYRPLEEVQDNYPKYVMTVNDLIQKRNGIIHVNMPEFMADGKGFCPVF